MLNCKIYKPNKATFSKNKAHTFLQRKRSNLTKTKNCQSAFEQKQLNCYKPRCKKKIEPSSKKKKKTLPKIKSKNGSAAPTSGQNASPFVSSSWKRVIRDKRFELFHAVFLQTFYFSCRNAIRRSDRLPVVLNLPACCLLWVFLCFFFRCVSVANVAIDLLFDQNKINIYSIGFK